LQVRENQVFVRDFESTNAEDRSHDVSGAD
jgi:hypothetical protein